MSEVLLQLDIGFYLKYPSLLSCLNEFRISSTDFRKKKTREPNFIKIRPMRDELFHAGRRTDMTKLIVAFRNFVKSPTNCIHEGIKS